MHTIGQSLDAAFYMFWQTLWALILGFVLSGAVQAFVSRRQMQRTMGDHGPAAIVRSSLLGAASSSCSYAASALARSLFGRGADFTAAMVFMIASTNLVVELGLVLWLLLGWQFAAAEFVGGAIMIALLSVLLPRAIPSRQIDEARRGAAAEIGDDPDDSAPGLRRRLRQPARWAAAAGYTISDLTMLRREILLGFLAAGFVAIAIPVGFWNAVFLHGHGIGTTLENAAIGPAVAIVSLVCSIGNVPLAAALWADGISFGGVVAFIFADLISLPLLLVYRRLYGGRLTLRLLGVFWLVMSVSGVATQLIFHGLGAIPDRRATVVMSEHVTWNHTTVLNIVFLAGFAGLLWVNRHRDRFGDRPDDAVETACPMHAEPAHAVPTSTGAPHD